MCNLSKLEVFAGYSGYIKLPSVLFACQKLAVLKLEGRILVNVLPTVCLPSLKTLHFYHLMLLKDESILKILSSCPLLSDLRLEYHIMSKLHFVMPSLQKLTIVTNSGTEHSPILLDDYIQSLEISTPSLKYLNVEDFGSTFYVRVRIRSPSNFEDTSIYRRIVQLKLSMYRGVFEELLIYLLERSINLSVLKINVNLFLQKNVSIFSFSTLLSYDVIHTLTLFLLWS
ncbi:BnaCnng15460D [Brassica napus]|uniref:BnaCnng15460D protein n=1 Tax=Brassica napus TaxID=3708 RepID=A0A078IA11_BRANA|nr:BnaCnng15460D [Brassica napus]